MIAHLRLEIEKLKKQTLSLSAIVEKSLWMAMRTVLEKDSVTARKVIESDSVIDKMEVEIEEECLKILALHQPVAVDLRFIVATLKMNNDLERIGDLAVNIAERGLYLAEMESCVLPFDFTEMAEKVQAMLKKSLDSLVNLDAKLAREVAAADDEIDDLHRKNYELTRQLIETQAVNAVCSIHGLSISRYLERIADLADNISEDVIYMVDGEIVRHKSQFETLAKNSDEK